jgi:hypothetical protein
MRRISAELAAQYRPHAALHYADLFKQGEHSIDKDEVYTALAQHFSDEEIIELGLFCARRNRIGRVGRLAGLHGVSRAVRVGYGTAHDSAGHHTSSYADTDSTAPTARFSRRRCQQGNCHRCGTIKREQGLVHGRLLLA